MTNHPGNDSARTLQTVSRAFDVIRALQELNGARVTEVADYLDLSKSVVYNYLGTLKKERYVYQQGDSYNLSLQFLLLGEFVRNQNSLFQNGRAEVDTLAAKTKEYAHLSTEQHGLSYNLYKVQGENAVGNEYQMRKLQEADYLHVSATGKAILAYLPAERVNWIIDKYGLPARTEYTITSHDDLLHELETIRENGYAINDEEEVRGLQAIGAPILSEHGRALGAISVSGPVRRFSDEGKRATIIDGVTNTANVIEAQVNMNESNDEFPTFT